MHSFRSVAVVTVVMSAMLLAAGTASGFDAPLDLVADASSGPMPLLGQGHPTRWWFAFKFNATSFPGCGDGASPACPFGGEVQDYKRWGQQFVFASSEHPTLQRGGGCVGDTGADPLGATFGEIYEGGLNYVIWNDQFYGDPMPSRSGSWGHSKGALAWNDAGEGLVLQVSTPSWPASGSGDHPRRSDGNTLGCVKDDNVMASQHFFALALTAANVEVELRALANASVVTDVNDPQVVKNGGPPGIQALVSQLGVKSKSTTVVKETLSSGVTLISKPSKLRVPPWQLVSSVEGGLSLRVATWWMAPVIADTTAATQIDCWDASLAPSGAVENARQGGWEQATFVLRGGPNFNHAKIGVSDAAHHLAIFGDLNQQGALSGKCDSSQNGRGGLFYVVDDPDLSTSVRALIGG